MNQPLLHNRVRRPFLAGAWRVLPLLLLMLVSLAGCKTAGTARKTASDCLSSKVKLTIPTKDAVYTVNGTMKLQGGELMQLSFLMPLLRTEVARVEVAPDYILLVDRMGKRYARLTRAELRGLLPRKASFGSLEKMLFKAAKPGAKRSLTGEDVGISGLKKGKIELSDFSDKPLSLTPTELSSRYRKVELKEILEMLLSL